MAKKKEYTAEERQMLMEKIKDARQSGLSISGTAKSLGLPLTTVYGWTRKMKNLKTQAHGRTKSQNHHFSLISPPSQSRRLRLAKSQ